MDRIKLMRVLEVVEPARSTQIINPILNHFWFRGDRIMAFNDFIAISVDYKTGVKDAVPGQILDWLKAHSSGTKEVEISEAENQAILVEAGKSKLTLQTMSVDACDKMFPMPNPEKDKNDLLIEFASSGAFLDAIKDCMRSVGTDSAVPDQMGVTLIPDGSDLMRLFSINDKTMTACEVKIKRAPYFKRATLSAVFCNQLLKLADKAKFALYVADDYSLAYIEDTTLFGRLIESSRPIEYGELLDRYSHPDIMQDAVEVPPIRHMLDRAIVAAGSGAEEVQTEIHISDGKIKFSTQARIIDIQDSAEIDEHHPNVSLRANIRWLRIGYEAMPKESKIVFSKNSIVMLHQFADKKGKGRAGQVYVIATGK